MTTFNAAEFRALDEVTGWYVATVQVKGVKRKGYGLIGRDNVTLGFIETLGPNKRIEELLTQYAERGLTARALMRTLLNEEDYRSDIYDFIVRVYYPEDIDHV